MKVLAIMGSPRKGQTERMFNQFQEVIENLGEVEFEHLFLRDLNLQPCKGCGLCLEIGEEKCPIKDDRDLILNKLMSADGIIFATPNYSLQVSGLMKIFLDRFAFVFHRPCFFHKTAMGFVTQGVFGGGNILKYMNEVFGFWGLNICKGIVLSTPWGVRNPNAQYPDSEVRKIKEKVNQGAVRFYNQLKSPQNPSPSLKRVAFFRLTRSAHKYSKEHKRDYEYFKNNGWFESDYFYETKMGIHKKLLGNVIDGLIGRQAEKGT